MSTLSSSLFTKPTVHSWLKAIAAVGVKNNVIGNNKKLPWNIPEESKFYFDTVKGHEVIFGRTTYEGGFLTKFSKIYVISSTMQKIDGASVIRDYNEIQEPPKGKILWVCGGQRVYKDLLPYCSELYISHIKGDFDGDTFFPEYKNDFHVKETLIDCNDFCTRKSKE
ncbi:Dihydrofolate reductase [Tritrichomonas foetus]|uniref:dihydrofolate reductase n=1 Tax=Tritrichomonas foetus TaxID=1144522 RepID=A0A1J4JAN5_9EUKA|nr:Dihydrofolate reductase [Tritrichomonas foetus]|eukprot:OHS96242.1 Dihydrofolate reductase [Tritrichomonas foetus]